jgi:phosphoglycerate dehydrogenase-like enzyme
LNAQVLLIVGYGSIGRELARRATAFAMRVRAVTRSGQGHTTYAEKIVPVSQWHQVLPHADFVVIAAPETAETRHLIGRAELARMKPAQGW